MMMTYRMESEKAHKGTLLIINLYPLWNVSKSRNCYGTVDGIFVFDGSS